MASAKTVEIDLLDQQVADDVQSKLRTGEPTDAKISVDERVLARVTDGIYRQPSSAPRELIANAYDADATEVIIHTDPPRFDRITISDNGQGMSPDSLIYLIHHIGGSAKRTQIGKRLNITNPDNPSLSPGGRRLIGKIGIGLFAVSQLTQHFQVITKRKGDDYRTSADVVLRTHTEENLKNIDDGGSFETGSAVITTEAASDVDSQGTEIILMNLRRNARELLQSADRWRLIVEPDEDADKPLPPPAYHIGVVQKFDTGLFELKPQLPWEPDDSPETKFKRLFEKLGEEANKTVRHPDIHSSLDAYLAMLWTLSLGSPVAYIDGHPFQLKGSDGVQIYWLSNEPRGQSEPVEIGTNETVADALGMQSGEGDPCGGFRVLIDGVELLRPIQLDSELLFRSQIGQPLLFVGQCDTPLGQVEASRGGGELTFESYIYWNARIVPKENNGVLVRINEASGVLFDENFMNYQVSELTRRRQLMAEVFVIEGMDAALNIDRESFNFSHPHYQFVQKWMHSAVRQVMNRLKAIEKEKRDENRRQSDAAARGTIANLSKRIWNERKQDEPEPVVRLLPRNSEPELALESRHKGEIAFEHERIFGTEIGAKQLEGFKASEKAEALVKVLEAYGLLEELSYEEQQNLIRDIFSVFAADL